MSYFDDMEDSRGHRFNWHQKRMPFHKATAPFNNPGRQSMTTLCGLTLQQERTVHKISKVTCKNCLAKLPLIP